MIEAIHTAVKGRGRYRVHGLYGSESLKRYLELKFSNSDKEGITLVSANTLTGNILVVFDSDKNPLQVVSALEEVISEHTHLPSDRKSKYAEPVSSTPQLVRNRLKSGRKSEKIPINTKEQTVAPWYRMGVDSVLAVFNTSRLSGLSSESAQESLKKYGPNILSDPLPRSGLDIFLDQLKVPPTALLTIAAGVSIFTGGMIDALVILGGIVLSATLGYITETQSEQTIHSLQSLIKPSALVIRDGNQKEIKAEEIVPGDILVLRPGSYIAADSRLIEAHYLSIDESTLTGESLPAIKTAEPIASEKNIPLADRVNMVYRGTLVTGGQGLAVVVATGKFTERGQIQTLVEDAESPKTALEQQLSKMGHRLALIGGAICGAALMIGFLRGYSFIQILTTSLSLAVAALPGGLSTISGPILTLGIRDMRKHKVLMRRLNAIETLGSVQIVCLDKTGTITLNKMSVVAMHTGMKHIEVFNGTFIINGKAVNPFAYDELLRLIHISVLCSETEISKKGDEYVLSGSSTENSLVYMALNSGLDVLKLREKYPVLKVSYRSENRHYMSTLHITHNGEMTNHHKEIHNHALLLLSVKGSPNEVLSMCSWYIKDGVKIPLTEDARLSIEVENERMAGKALRVLGVAYTYIQDGENDLDNPSGLIWLGLVGMMDPIRKGAREMIQTLHQAGIDTVMITGDQSPTAYAIGKELNLSQDQQLEILDSTNLANIDADVMTALASKVHVFARVSPAQKLQIVQALQRSGKIVAMTGDGINDGPALKAADIGIAMGDTGTDVAKEVSSIVLEDDNLEAMTLAISQGRTIYNNVKKSVHFLLSKNLSEITVMFVTMAGGIGQPLSAMHIPRISVTSDILPGLALALDPPEPDVLSRPPRNPQEPIITSSNFKKIVLESMTLAAGALGVYGYGIARYGVGARAGTIAFTSLTTGQLLHAIHCRSEERSLFDREVNRRPSLPSNKYLNIVLSGAFTLQALSMVVPRLRDLFGLTPISVLDGAVVAASALFSFLVNETTKS